MLPSRGAGKVGSIRRLQTGSELCLKYETRLPESLVDQRHAAAERPPRLHSRSEARLALSSLAAAKSFGGSETGAVMMTLISAVSAEHAAAVRLVMMASERLQEWRHGGLQLHSR